MKRVVRAQRESLNRSVCALRLYSTVLAAICVLVRPVQANSGPSSVYDFRSQTKYCYSCMSEDFLQHWPFLQELYFPPMNFTDQCFSIPHRTNMGVQPCSSSMCITVIEPKILAGQHIGNSIMRGCLTSVFRYIHKSLPTPSIVSDTSCTRLAAKKLIPPQYATRSSNRSVEMCWCVNQLCNDYPSVPTNSRSSDRYSSLSTASLLIMTFILERLIL